VPIPLVGMGVGFLARKFAKKGLRRIIAGAVPKTAIGRVLGASTGVALAVPVLRSGGSGGGGLTFPKFPSPFEPGRNVFGRNTSGAVIDPDNGRCPVGYHLDKKTRSKCVRNRRVNYANGRAAKRAGRRLRGTVKMLKQSFSLVTGRAPKGKFIPRKKG
jgi:hypothetical protein